MDIRKIKKLIELLEESGIAEIEIKEGEEAVRISRMPAGGAMVHPMAAPAWFGPGQPAWDPSRGAAPLPLAAPAEASGQGAGAGESAAKPKPNLNAVLVGESTWCVWVTTCWVGGTGPKRRAELPAGHFGASVRSSRWAG